jgi:hypothetical protein
MVAATVVTFFIRLQAADGPLRGPSSPSQVELVVWHSYRVEYYLVQIVNLQKQFLPDNIRSKCGHVTFVLENQNIL